MKFSSDASVDDPAVGVHFDERIGSWILSLQGGNEKKVVASEFDLSLENVHWTMLSITF